MISRIEAFKYRCFDRLDIKVGQYHVLAGANGTDKSTLLDIPFCSAPSCFKLKKHPIELPR
jgi:predicted ATPase